jgi:hypothetical protein
MGDKWGTDKAQEAQVLDPIAKKIGRKPGQAG